MTTEIINIDNTIEEIKEAIDYTTRNLDLSQLKFTIKDQFMFETSLYYPDAIKKIIQISGGTAYNGHLSVALKNCYIILERIKTHIDSSRIDIDNKIIELIRIIEKMHLAYEQLQEEVAELEKDNEKWRIKYETLTEDRHRTEIDDLKAELRMLKMQGCKPIKEDNPDKYFDTEPERPEFEEDDEYIEEPVTGNKKIIQEIHTKILDNMKKIPLYPLHKQDDLSEVQERYKEFWYFLGVVEYGLSERDCPKFIDHLQDFRKYDDKYLDEVRE